MTKIICPVSKEIVTVLTIVEQIGCTDSGFENAYGNKRVSILPIKNPLSCEIKLYSARLVTIASILTMLLNCPHHIGEILLH